MPKIVPDAVLYSIIKKYGRLTMRSDNGYYIFTLYMDNGMVFSTGSGTYHNALIELYDEIRYHLMVATGSLKEFE
jgi:hypothetical protein